jgi:hypothetical protein
LSTRWRNTNWLILTGIACFIMLAYVALQFEVWLGVITPILIYTISLIAIRYDLYRLYRIPEYEDFALAITEAQNGRYTVAIIYSPAGEETENLSFAKFFEDRAFVTIEEKLRKGSASLHEMRELGCWLYDAVFQRSIETRLLQSLAMVKRERKHLRIRLRLDTPEVSRLPWEYMFGEKSPNGFIALNNNLSIARYITSVASFTRTEYRGPLRILVAIANPANLPPLDVAAEKAQFKKSLRALLWLRQVHITFCEDTTLEKLHQKIVTGKHHVLHYIGHGGFDEAKVEGHLLFEDEGGAPCPVESEALGQILNDSSIRLAVLNCCEAAVTPKTNELLGVVQKLVKVGVPAVISMQHKIQDDIAILFTKTF